MPETVLGLNAYHGDAAASLVVDGEIVAAVEEERFTRLKHQAGFPARSVAWCLRSNGLGLADVDHVAIGRNPKAQLAHKLAHTLRRRPSGRWMRDRLENARRVTGVGALVAEAAGEERLLPATRLHNVEHHRAHLASAF